MKKIHEDFKTMVQSGSKTKVHTHEAYNASTSSVEEVFDDLKETLTDNQEIGLVICFLSCHANVKERYEFFGMFHEILKSAKKIVRYFGLEKRIDISRPHFIQNF